MRSDDEVRRVFELWEQCWNQSEIARETGVSRAQIGFWLNAGLKKTLASPMRRTARACDGSSCGWCDELPGAEYAYLLGQYLGDGCISRHPRDVYRLRIATCDDYPMVRSECIAAMEAVMPDRRISLVQCVGCTEVAMFSKHWPCLFPQHGRGMKHLRPIELAPWQERIALDDHPQFLLRGLVHSDGCRITNWVPRKDGGRYEYPRYFFTNRSDDIRRIFTAACDRLDVEWRVNKRYDISVAKRDSVARLDQFIGPKR